MISDKCVYCFFFFFGASVEVSLEFDKVKPKTTKRNSGSFEMLGSGLTRRMTMTSWPSVLVCVLADVDAMDCWCVDRSGWRRCQTRVCLTS